MRENFWTSELSISGNFEQLWFLWQKSPPCPPGWGKFLDQIYPFQAISSNFGFCGRKAPTPRMKEIFLTSDLSISGNSKQLWILWQKSPPPQDEGTFFDFRSIHFRQFWAILVFVAEKPPSQDEGKFWTSELSISGNFKQLWFLWQKSPPPPMREKFWLQIYPFQAILSNFGFCGRKAPPPPRWGKIFWLQIFGFCGLHHTGRIPMVPILQIHTQISPIWISSIGYQLCQLFKILTYTELQDSGSWCIWKVYRQPYHNTH